MYDPAVASIDRLKPSDFRRLAAFIEDYSGIRMPPTKLTMLEGRLRHRMRDIGAASLADYCRDLFQEDGLQSEAVHLIDAVTTNKTDFFREPEHFRILVRQALPTLLADRHAGPQAQVKLWSAACSTGPEPYTLAMVLDDWRQQKPGQRFAILGTDLSTDALETARRAIYPEAMVAVVPPDLRHRYLLRSRDRSRHLVRVVPELRSWVNFGRLNLMDSEYPVDRDHDVIFCRNVLIYFDKPTQHAVLQRLCRHLRPGGYLFLGHSESLAGMALPLRSVANTVLRRPL
ncbi:MAG TPA: CheR family methyltransferase [Acetobacteraceae bacterium]|nr:CheR family methyltransferase [Acetobacteraceae bacterium]